MTTTVAWLKALRSARSAELTNSFVDLTLVCRLDAAINDLMQIDWTSDPSEVESLLLNYHNRAANYAAHYL